MDEQEEMNEESRKRKDDRERTRLVYLTGNGERFILVLVLREQ